MYKYHVENTKRRERISEKGNEKTRKKDAWLDSEDMEQY